MLRPSSVAFSDSFPPRGSLKKGIDLHFKLFATIRYETGDARPGGKPGKNWATHNMLRPSSVAFSDSFPPEKIGLHIICYAPWLSEIFYQKYSENQKLATRNMVRPSSVAFSDSFPPGGSPENCLQQSVTKRAMSAPGGEDNKRLIVLPR